MAQRIFDKGCCNPLNLHDKPACNGVRKISKNYAAKYSAFKIKEDLYICATCRKKLAIEEKSLQEIQLPEPTDNESSCSNDKESTEENVYVDKDTELKLFNESLISGIGESPVKKQKLLQGIHYVEEKVHKINDAVRTKFQILSPSTAKEISKASSETIGQEEEMINQLKEKFRTTEKRSEKLQILTVLPKSWSRNKIQEEFNVTQYMARQAKNLVKEKGIMSLPNKRLPTFPPETVNIIQKFYKCEEVSRIMPGKKDYKSVRKEGVKVQEQKHLILCNLREAYELFKSKNPSIKVGFSKFAELRPKECILVGGAGTHTVCVCTVHQNMKLMLIGSSLSSYTKGEKFHLCDYGNCLAAITCNESSTNCFFDQCSNCKSKFNNFAEFLEMIFEKNMIDDISYKRWLSTDRATLESITKPVSEFTEDFCTNLQILKRHDYITKQQSTFCREKKDALNDGEIMILGDFAENYSFILQDAAQGYHWNNAQATLHPFVCYYKDRGELKHVNVVIISNCLIHDTIAVHLFQKKLLEMLKTKIPFEIKKSIYFSDGAVSQYKNYKNFINLCHHEADFKMKAEWHFFATSHGKGPCDGLGGTIKRLAAKASLQRPYNDQIMTPRQLFDFGKENIEGIFFLYSSTEEWLNEKTLLKERFDTASTIPGTQKLHSFVPISLSELQVKFVSNITDFQTVRVVKQTSLLFEDIKGFVTAMYDKKWYLACVLQTYPDIMEVKLTFLEPNGPSPSFKYPRRTDILTLPQSDILSIVDPKTVTGRMYQLSDKESNKASKLLNEKLS